MRQVSFVVEEGSALSKEYGGYTGGQRFDYWILDRRNKSESWSHDPFFFGMFVLCKRCGSQPESQSLNNSITPNISSIRVMGISDDFLSSSLTGWPSVNVKLLRVTFAVYMFKL